MKNLLAFALLICSAFALNAQTPVIGATPVPGTSTPLPLCHITTTSSHTGDVTPTLLGGCTIPANTLGNNSRVEVQIVTSATSGNATSCNFTPRIGAAGTVADTGFLSDASQASNASGQWKISINERNANNSQWVNGTQVRNGTLVNGGFLNLALSTATQIAINLWGTNGNTTDTCNLQEMDVTIWP